MSLFSRLVFAHMDKGDVYYICTATTDMHTLISSVCIYIACTGTVRGRATVRQGVSKGVLFVHNMRGRSYVIN